MSSATDRRAVSLLLPAPPAVEPIESQRHIVPAHVRLRQGTGWSTLGSSLELPDVVREQRDGLVRQRGRLATIVRRLQTENESLRRQLAQYQSVGQPERIEDEEAADARRLEHEAGVRFHLMPDGVYPGRPYVTQQDLIRQGVTCYSRQNMSRLARAERALPVVLIADRVLLPPKAVRALLEREKAAARDASPRRRPGGGRTVERRET